MLDKMVSCYFPTNDEQMQSSPLRETLQLVGGMWWHVMVRMENTSDKVIISTAADSPKLQEESDKPRLTKHFPFTSFMCRLKGLFVSTNSSLISVKESQIDCNTLSWLM